MKFKAVFIFTILVFFINSGFRADEVVFKPTEEELTDQLIREKYDFMCLASWNLDYEPFRLACKGFQKLKMLGKVQNNMLTVIDFSRSANTERLWIIDMNYDVVAMTSLVAHGKNTGQEFAYSFSNKAGTNKSSLGFYITGESYDGDNGLSLRLDGQEYAFNSNARNRNVVIHGAEYVSEQFIAGNQRLGRSQGCPAVPQDLNATIIDFITGGSCLFIYYPDKYYLSKSKLVN